jgi:hypothetical protein
LLPRLLLILLVAGGAGLWQSGWFTQTREFRWQLGEDRSSLAEVEIQIWNSAGELLKREAFFFANGVPAELIQRLALKDGEYRIETFVKRKNGQESGHGGRWIDVTQKVIVLPLP